MARTTLVVNGKIIRKRVGLTGTSMCGKMERPKNAQVSKHDCHHCIWARAIGELPKKKKSLMVMDYWCSYHDETNPSKSRCGKCQKYEFVPKVIWTVPRGEK